MNTEYTQFVATLLKRLAKLNYIKPGEVPNIDLYGRAFKRLQTP